MRPAEPAWLPAAFNRGHAYRDRVSEPAASISGFYAGRYGHSDRAVWEQRLAAGEIRLNGQQLRADGPLVPGDRLVWHRPPWQEAAVPVLPEHAVVFDDGDLLVLNKPSGLPVLPAGGFLAHTLLAQLEAWVAAGRLDAAAGRPRPVHRLGRFTSGLLVCARRPATRAWLSAQLRESTAAGAAADSQGCRKVYRALSAPLPPDWSIGAARPIRRPIRQRPHPLLGALWCAADPVEAEAEGAAPGDPAALPACSIVTLLERRPGACLLEVQIASGRPHQIRIHAAALGAPLLGDPLYLPGGLARPEALPGAGGYRLHAHRLSLRPPAGPPLELEAPLPLELERMAPERSVRGGASRAPS